jgi:hypothetical protein
MRVSIGRRGGTSAVLAGVATLFVSATAPAAANGRGIKRDRGAPD